MKLNDKQRLVLVSVLMDQRRLAAMDFHGGDGMEYMARGHYRLRISRARDGYVPVDLDAWLGSAPTNSQTVMFCREYERLERMGLVERCNFSGGRRTTHLRLTDEGQHVAQDLIDEEYGVASGADAIDWSKLEFLPIELPAEGDGDDDVEERPEAMQ
jgi:hypothetical protein